MTKMTKEDALIREIFEPGRKGTQALASAVREAGKLLFEERVAMDDILVTKDIYPVVARQLGKDSRNIARQVERLANQCWDGMDEEQKKRYIGKELKDIRAPKDVIFYLAFYVRFRQGFYRVLEKEPGLLFGKRDS
ncbi:MAG TPA: hypothetical protein DF613_08570 [Lachnospiraceae bacterium]|nr:hypothetical protein [Lachnospiraceae bacterium]